MRRVRGAIVATLCVAALMLEGCAAALLPVAAAGAVGTQQSRARNDRPRPDAQQTGDAESPRFTRAEVQPRDVTRRRRARARTASAAPAAPPAEAASIEGPYAAFVRFALERQRQMAQGLPAHDMLLVDPVTALSHPRFSPCGAKATAIVLDLDPASSSGVPPAPAVAAISTAPPPGLAAGLHQLRAAGISIFWISGRRDDQAAELAGELRQSGLDPAGDDWLFLVRSASERKQTRLRDAARDYCVIALAGDSKSDFDELYDYLRDPDGAIMLEQFFGEGWFLAPPPLGNQSPPLP